PAVKDENEEVFLISDFEMVQVSYDKAAGVSAISVTYSAEHPNPPTALAVLGEDVAADADGRIYKLIRYPGLGYWVAYSRTAGDAAVVSVTMRVIDTRGADAIFLRKDVGRSEPATIRQGRFWRWAKKIHEMYFQHVH